MRQYLAPYLSFPSFSHTFLLYTLFNPPPLSPPSSYIPSQYLLLFKPAVTPLSPSRPHAMLPHTSARPLSASPSFPHTYVPAQYPLSSLSPSSASPSPPCIMHTRPLPPCLPIAHPPSVWRAVTASQYGRQFTGGRAS